MAEYLIQGETLTAIAQAIRDKTGMAEPISVTSMPEIIAGITGGGGSSEDVRYVTFMSHDGQIEYGRIPVAVGYDCPKPKFDTPTRESTAQYSYTFVGWATTVNGALDDNALNAVNEDRTVYANFVSVVRFYTITYYDGDTVLKTESLAYGAMPKYTPEKSGFGFSGWTPALATVTGNASYTAKWTSTVTFANVSWSELAAISESGEAEQHFKLGDTRDIPIDSSGTVLTFEIIGFNHDNLSDGTGKAGITIATKTLPTTSYTKTNALSAISTICTNGFPSELRQHIKTVKKGENTVKTTDTITFKNCTGFLLSAEEINAPDNQSCSGKGTGEPYAYYLLDAENRLHKYVENYQTKSHSYWLRDNCSSFMANSYPVVVLHGDDYCKMAATTENHSLCFAFCI